MATANTNTNYRRQGYQKAKRPHWRSMATHGRDVEIVITPEELEHRRDVKGRPYAWVRGLVSYRTTNKIRTMMVQHAAYDRLSAHLAVGTTIKVQGYFFSILNHQTGEYGAEVFSAKDFVQYADTKKRQPAEPTGRTVEGHEREGHWRRQHYGPRNSLVKVIWISKVTVNGGKQAAARAA